MHALLRDAIMQDPSGHHHAPVIATLLQAIISADIESKSCNARDTVLQTRALLVARLTAIGVNEDEIKHAHIVTIPRMPKKALSGIFKAIWDDITRLLRVLSVTAVEDINGIADCIGWLICCMQTFAISASVHVVSLGDAVSRKTGAGNPLC